MTKITQSMRIGILAPSGYGKTYLAERLVNMISQKHKVVWYNTDFERHLLWKGNKNIIVFNPDKRYFDELEYLNDWLIQIRAENTNFMIGIDDLDIFYNDKTSMGKLSKALKDIASSGRHQRIGLIWVSKAMAYIPHLLIKNTNVFYFGQFVEESDLSRIRGIVNPELIVSLVKPTFLRYDRNEFEGNRIAYVKA
ncbi:MAG: hypothetical protein ACP5U0_07480 [Caldisphaera sp.]